MWDGIVAAEEMVYSSLPSLQCNREILLNFLKWFVIFLFVPCCVCIMSHSMHFQAGYVTLVDKVSVSSGRMKGFVFTK